MKNILVVDDSRTIRLVIRKLLESRGFTVTEAEHGRQALDVCRTGPAPDGMILDMNMPEMDGLACLRAVRQDPNLARCVVIICSTQVEAQQIAEAIESGANEYIMKPFTEEILFDKLRQVGLLE